MINYGNNAEELFDKEIFDKDGDKVGKVDNIYLDDATGKVKWLTVKTGLFGMKHAFVPVEAMEGEVSKLVLPYDKEFIKNAPHLDADKHISPEEEAELYRYYNLSNGHAYDAGVRNEEARENSLGAADATDGNYVARHGIQDGEVNEAAEATEAEPAPARHGDAHHRGEVAENGEDGMVLHEERVNVGTERVETGEARLHKTVVTETQSVDVPVTREEAHVVREPLNERVSDGIKLSEDEVAIELHEERPVVEKETVAVERVSLDTETVTDTERVSVEAAREEVALENVTHGEASHHFDGDGNGENHQGENH